MDMGRLAELAIEKQVITWVLTVLVTVGGALAFQSMPRLEDPEYTIKEALIVTPYPGASAAEVEEEVTSVVEKACQRMGQLWWVESRSQRGLSIVKATIREEFSKAELPQVWDELRKKVGAALLPPGAGPAIVNDDFGDVYGIYLALTGEEYSDAQLEKTAKLLQRELLLVQDVKSIAMYGVQPEVIYVEMDRQRMAKLGISTTDIYLSLASKNFPVTAGSVEAGDERLAVDLSGQFGSEEQFGDLLISGRGHGADSLIYLKDVATIRRDYLEPPLNLMRVDRKRAIGLGISTISGGNVVTMGNGIDARLAELETEIPLGMDIEIVTLQSVAVTKAINSFLINLAEAVAIVIVVLLVVMGMRSGLIIGAVLLVTIIASFIPLSIWGTMLERVSLAALVIALGMLVDNAIVVTDSMRVKMKAGVDAVRAAREVVGQSAMPLLGATVVAILAFAMIGLAPGDAGEIMTSLFRVILVSLLISWVTAITITPLFCRAFLEVGSPDEGGEQEDPYAGALFQGYRRLLGLSLRYRMATVLIVVALFAAAVGGFTRLKLEFFPPATRAQFFIDFWLPEGTSIEATARALEPAEEYLVGVEGVEKVVTTIGGGDIRFLLTYAPEYPWASFGQILVNTDSAERVETLLETVQTELDGRLPNAIINVRKFSMGPGLGGKIQLRISGSDPLVVRELARHAEDILRADPGAKAVRSNWREPVKIVRPVVAEDAARRAGITRPQIADALLRASTGKLVGIFRDGETLVPIIARAPDEERSEIDAWAGLPVFSPVALQTVPLGQVVSRLKTEVEEPYIWRRNRVKTITVHADPVSEFPSAVVNRVKAPIEAALGVDVARVTGKTFAPGEDPFAEHTATTIPPTFRANWPLIGAPGYSMGWGGEQEDGARGTQAVLDQIPLYGTLMVLIVIILFNSLRKPAIIFLTVPLSIIGVTAGLLLLGVPFSFVALGGLLSLSGMLIKNAIVLIDSIDFELAAGKPGLQAISDAGVSRVVPVSMAAVTTILGMAPLLGDVLFKGMAVTIMFGLAFATVLTLVFVPVLYAMFFRIGNEKHTPEAEADA